MKTPISRPPAAIAALLAGTAIAGDQPRGDAPRHELRADTDGDGRVSRAEATAAGAERSGEWFDKLDANKDGYVTQEEMRSGPRDAPRRMMRERMDEHFKDGRHQQRWPAVARRSAGQDAAHGRALQHDRQGQERLAEQGRARSAAVRATSRKADQG